MNSVIIAPLLSLTILVGWAFAEGPRGFPEAADGPRIVGANAPAGVPAVAPIRMSVDADADAPKKDDAPKEKTPDDKKPAAGEKDKDVPEGAPPIEVVKKQLEVQWGPLGKTTKHVYDYKSIRFAPPMKEVVTINGQSRETGRIRYPVRVVCEITVNFSDGTSRKETKKQTFHFFLDEFKEWTYRFMQNDD